MIEFWVIQFVLAAAAQVVREGRRCARYCDQRLAWIEYLHPEFKKQ